MTQRFFSEPNSTAAALRRELSRRNIERAKSFEHELTYGEVPSILYREQEGVHGNFFPASYRAICSAPDWAKRLKKTYSGGRRIARSWERRRCELDCANSSDALLMNVFCYPRLLRRTQVCSLLGIQAGLRPEFGFKPRIAFLNGSADQTEIDMRLGRLLVEAKLTETGFQTAPLDRLIRYRDLGQVFNIEELPMDGDSVHSYQLIRGVLAAYQWECSFLLLCDRRRGELQEHWFQILRAVPDCSLRSRLAFLTWQELANTLPEALQFFLEDKYGIGSIEPTRNLENY